MIEEELDKEADEYAKKLLEGTEFEDDDMVGCAYTKREMLEAILHFAEPREKRIAELEKENKELRKVAEFQQSSNMSRHFQNKKLKEGLAVGSTFNKGLNAMNKALKEERDKYRNMVFDKDEQLIKAKKQIQNLIKAFVGDLVRSPIYFDKEQLKAIKDAEQFLKDSDVEK